MTWKSRLILLVCICFILSCKSETIKPSIPDGFIATCEQQATATKTQLYEGNTVLWDRDDAIRVYDVSRMEESGYSGSAFTLDPADAGKKEGRFIGLDDAITSIPCYAVYPSSAVKSTSPNGFSVSLPEIQYYREGSFCAGTNISAATGSGDGTLSFRNLCGLLAVNVSGINNFSEISVTTLGDESLWGEGEIDMSETTPVLKMTGEITAERKTLVLKRDSDEGDGQFVEQGSASGQTGDDFSGDAISNRTFYFVVPVGTLSQGFILTVKNSNGAYMQRYTGAHVENTIERSTGTVMPSQQFYDESDVEIRTDVQNKAFYKDAFSDQGPGLGRPGRFGPAAYKMLAANPAVRLTYEYFEASLDYHQPFTSYTQAELKRFRNALCGCDSDLNGILLYPDGEPRFKLFYSFGGSCDPHLKALTNTGRENIRHFLYSGGSYSGSCAGAFFAAMSAANPDQDLGWMANNNCNYAIWPGYATNFYGGHTLSFRLPSDSPLLKYYSYGDDNRVDGIMHENGCFFVKPEDQVPGTRTLAYYYYPGYACDGYSSVISFKPSLLSGIIAIQGSHPELVTDFEDERCKFTAALYRYALENVGIAKVKGILHNGETRRMTKSTEDCDPDYTKIGDKQCHHFAFGLPAAAKNIRVRMESLDGFNLSLRMAKGTFAFKEDVTKAKFKVENTDAVKELYFDTLPRGTWYIGVQCEDTVETSTDKYGTIYTGNTAVLNGAAYTISVSWETGVPEDHSIHTDTESMDASDINLNPGQGGTEIMAQTEMTL